MVRWRNLFVAPRARLMQPSEDGSSVVEVDGLLCRQVCVRRVQQSLAALPGVSDVMHLPDTDRFVLNAAGQLAEPEVDAAVQRVVVFRPLRLGLGRLAGLLSGALAWR